MAQDVYQVEKVQDGFYAIDEGGVRSFLVVGDKEALLIDTGFGKGDLEAVVKGLTDKLIQLLQTHADGDHTGCSARFPQVWLHPAEEPRFRRSRADYQGEKRYLCDGELVDVSPWHFRVLHIPGHTPGSIALLEEEKRFLISGDSVQSGAVFMFGDGRDLNAYLGSLKRLQGMKGAFDVVYPSHGELTVAADILDDLVEGTEKLLAGELEPIDPPRAMPCKLYRHKRAQFLAPDGLKA